MDSSASKMIAPRRSQISLQELMATAKPRRTHFSLQEILENRSRRTTISVPSEMDDAILQKIQNCIHGECDKHSIYTLIDNMSPERIRQFLENTLGKAGHPFAFYNANAALYMMQWDNIAHVKYKDVNDNLHIVISYTKEKGGSVFTGYIKAMNRKRLIQLINDPMREDRPENDILILDNVNGHAFAHLIKLHPGIEQSINRFRSSFTLMLSNDISSRSRNWRIMEIADVKNALFPFSEDYSPPDINSAEARVYCASLFDFVSGETVGNNFLRRGELFIYDMIKALPIFVDHLQILGLNYGMLHNDLHLDNIMFDENTQRIVMFDYGRMTFPKELVDKYINIEQNRYFFDDPVTYENLTKHYAHSTKVNGLFVSHIFDYVTLTTNLYYGLVQTGVDCTKCFTNLLRFNKGGSVSERSDSDSDSNIDYDILTDMIVIPNSYEDIQLQFITTVNKILKFRVNTDTKKGLLCIAEGLFFMAWILMKISKNTQEQKVQFMIYDDLVMNKKMFRHIFFQFHTDFVKSMTEPLYNDLMSNIRRKDVYEYSRILQKLRTPSSTGGRRKKMTGGLGYQTDSPRSGGLSDGNGMIMAMIANDSSGTKGGSNGCLKKYRLQNMCSKKNTKENDAKKKK